MRKDAIESCLEMLQITKKVLERNGDWPEVKEEISELLHNIEIELKNDLNAKESEEKIERYISRSLWILRILLGLME